MKNEILSSCIQKLQGITIPYETRELLQELINTLQTCFLATPKVTHIIGNFEHICGAPLSFDRPEMSTSAEQRLQYQEILATRERVRSHKGILPQSLV